MLKKMLTSLLVLLLLVSASFAVIKGIENTEQSLVKVGESLTVLEGANVDSAVSVGGSVTVLGKVAKDVVSVGGSVYLKDGAVVGGDVVSVGGKIVKDPGAVIKGQQTEIAMAGVEPAVSYFTQGGMLKGLIVFGLLSFIGYLILAILVIALFTPQLGRVSGFMEHDLLKTFLIGLAILVLFIPVVLVLVVSIIGIPLIPVVAIILAAAVIFGYIALAHLLGKKTLHAMRIYGQSMMTETLIGIVLLAIVKLIPIGGQLVIFIAVLCGIGGAWQTRFGTR